VEKVNKSKSVGKARLFLKEPRVEKRIASGDAGRGKLKKKVPRCYFFLPTSGIEPLSSNFFSISNAYSCGGYNVSQRKVDHKPHTNTNQKNQRKKIAAACNKIIHSIDATDAAGDFLFHRGGTLHATRSSRFKAIRLQQSILTLVHPSSKPLRAHFTE
jgi:hypothetical protein